jgi:hypothetical protein
MITTDLVQIAVIAWMKSKPLITSSIPAGATEIREDQWTSPEFTYPNIRVKMMPIIPILSPNCDVSRAEFDILIHSIEASSLQAETISAGIVNQMHNKRFTQNSIQFVSVLCTGQVPAIRFDSEGLWRSVVHLQAVVA